MTELVVSPNEVCVGALDWVDVKVEVSNAVCSGSLFKVVCVSAEAVLEGCVVDG